MNLCLFEDELEFCNRALDIDKDHVKSLFRKAKVLAYLFQFKQSIQLFQSFDKEN